MRANVDTILIAAVILGVTFLCLQLMTFGYGRDQGIYAMVGKAIVQGKMPYRDAWDFKPPFIFVIYAASRAVFGAGQVGIRIVEAAGIVAMIAAMVRLADVWWGDRRIGWVAGAVAALVHAQLDFWHTAQPESFGGMITIAALLALGPHLSPNEGAEGAAASTMDKARHRALFLCGALFGVTALLKPPLAGGGAVVAAALGIAALRRGEGLKAALRPALFIVLGGATPLLLCFLWFWAKGALSDLYYVLFVFTPHYTKLSWEGETLGGMAYWGFTEWLTTYSSVPTVGLLLCLGFRPRARELSGALLILAIIVVHLAGVVMQGKFFPYHYGATWPLTALLAAMGYVRLWDALTRSKSPLLPAPAGAVLFFACFTAVAFFRTATKDVPKSFLYRCEMRAKVFTSRPFDQRTADWLASVADVNAGANREVAELLRARVPNDRTVLVWGFEPVIYDLADRAPATRYLYNVPQRVAWAKARERAVLMRDLAANKPKAIVVERRDVFPMVTGDAIDSADTLKGFPELRDLIADHYEHAATIEDFEIYVGE